ncbi:putative sugar phosphate transporter domain-containing protein [Lupinus albus]|uniref:Putative sugar phosphate transporter domain-containing protein n=1 Tax=Lupinus albus TaxID=3870 RepID=A0A6A4PS96_LUPAL|nr:putative sugar phosphate transporter domain-containing protein [Lupinus albus]
MFFLLPILGWVRPPTSRIIYCYILRCLCHSSKLYTHNFSARTALHPPNFDFTIFRFSCFMGTMISSLAFVLRNISSKKSMRGKLVSIMNYYACLSTLSLVILTPFAMAVEGPQMWTAGYRTTFSNWTPIFMVITNDMQARLVGTSANRPCKRP